MEIIDETGKPRDLKDIEDAQQAVVKNMGNMSLPPQLLMALPVIWEALKFYGVAIYKVRGNKG